MNTSTARRPVGVTIVGVLMIIAGALTVIAGILALVGAASGASADINGVGIGPAGFTATGIIAIIIGALNILLAFGILRGNNTVRVIVTILQVISLVGAVWALVSGTGTMWSNIQNIVIPIIIIALLWAGEKTKAFFAKR